MIYPTSRAVILIAIGAPIAAVLAAAMPSLWAAGIAWAISGLPLRFAQVLVLATPCPLLIAAPVAYVAGTGRLAKDSTVASGLNQHNTSHESSTGIFHCNAVRASHIRRKQILIGRLYSVRPRDAAIGPCDVGRSSTQALPPHNAGNHSMPAANRQAINRKNFRKIVGDRVQG